MDKLSHGPRTINFWAPTVGGAPANRAPANSNFANSGSHQAGTGAAHPQDVFAGSGSSLQVATPSAREIQGHIAAAQAEKDKVIASMMKQGVGQPTGAQQQNLNKELSSIDTDVLSLVAKNGTKMGVATPGDNLVALGAITPLTEAGIEASKPLWNASAQAVTETTESYVGALQKQQAFADKGGDPKSEEGLRLSRSVSNAEHASRDVWMDQPDNGNVRPMRSPLNQASDTLSGNSMAGASMLQMIAQQTPTTVPLETIARSSAGAVTPKETKEFTDIVRSMNAEALPGIAERGKESLTQQASNTNPVDYRGTVAKQELAQSEGKTYVNWDSENMLLPDLYYHRDRDPQPAFGAPFNPDAKPSNPADKPAILVDGHDKRVIDGWGNGTTTMVDTMTEATAHGGGYVAAQHFPKQDLVLFREGEEKSGVHELGHVVEGILEKKDPKWFAQWSDRVDEAFDAKSGGGKSITDYALEDPGEYVAEGFSHYYEDPKALREKDPVLFGLTEEMVKRARELGRQ